MATTEKQGLQIKNILTQAEVLEILALVQLCNEHDQLHTLISPEALHQRSGTENDDFLYYEQGQLVGYLYVESWGSKEKEVTGVVRPEFRRRGFFRQLLAAAQADCKTRGVEYLILICEEHSHTGHAFVHAIKAHHDFSEHAMVLKTFKPRGYSDPQFQMRHATPADFEDLAAIFSSDIGSLDDARQFVKQFDEKPDQHFYLATLATQPLGCLRLAYQEDRVGIYSFVVRSEFRGKGFGRQMLEYIIPRIIDEGALMITLEVDTTNHQALGLYGSCGFEVTATYEYFNYPI